MGMARRSSAGRACDLARRHISAQLDDELGALEAARLHAHLGVCPQCRRFRRELQSITAQLRHDERELASVFARARRRSLTAPVAGALAVACVAAVAFTAVRPRSNPEVSIAASLAAQGTPVPVLLKRAYEDRAEQAAPASTTQSRWHPNRRKR
jgi:predicted anti-sigma-YlaC factor YlaD